MQKIRFLEFQRTFKETRTKSGSVVIPFENRSSRNFNTGFQRVQKIKMDQNVSGRACKHHFSIHYRKSIQNQH